MFLHNGVHVRCRPAEVLRFRHFLSFRENAEGLNKGRNVGKIDGIFGGGSMFKLPGAVSTPCQNFLSHDSLPREKASDSCVALWRPCDGVRASSAVPGAKRAQQPRFGPRPSVCFG